MKMTVVKDAYYILKTAIFFAIYQNPWKTTCRNLESLHEHTSELMSENSFSTFNSVICSTQYGREVSKKDFMEIIRLNRERCLLKGFKSGCDDIYANGLFELMKSYGYVTYFKLEDKVIAGIILTRFNEACLHVISHDNSYNDSHIGYVILKKVMEQLIKDNIHEFNFLWGDYLYKYQFGGEKKILYDVIYFKYSTDYYLTLFVDKSKAFRKALFGFIKKFLRPFYHLARRTFKWLINSPPFHKT